MRKAGVKQGDTQLSKLAEPAHLLDWVYTYNNQSDEPMEMLCMYAFLAANPSGQFKTNVGNSSHGLTQLSAYLDSKDDAPAFLDLLVEFDDLELLFTLMENREKIDKLVRATLVSAQESGHIDDVLSLDTMWRFWNELVDVFGKDVVLQQLPKHGSALVKQIIDHGSLDSEDIGMYDALLQDPDAAWYTELSQILNKYFNKWTPEDWSQELTGEGNYTSFIEGLFKTPAAPKLNDQFMQGLSAVAKKMIDEGASFIQSIKNHQAWLEHFESSDACDTLAGYILKHIQDSKKCPPDQLLEMFGPILAQEIIRESKDMNLGEFLYEIVKSPTDTNLQWMAGLCEEEALDVRSRTEGADLFHNKIRELIGYENLSEERRAYVDTIARTALPPEPDVPEPNENELKDDANSEEQ